MKTISLHSRLLLACMIPIAILMVLFSVFVILFRFQDIDNLKEETAKILLGKYSLALAQTPNTEWPTLINEALNEKYIRSIDIFDKTAHKIAHAGPQSTLKGLDPVKLSALHQTTSHLPYNNADIFLTPIDIPNISHKNANNYWLVIELQPAFFTIARYEVIIGISIITFGFITILMLWISGNIRHWLNPLHKMLEQLQHITPQQLDKRLATDAVGDIHLLEQQFNALLDRVSYEYQELNQSIEQARADLDENLLTIESRNIELHLAHNAALQGSRTKSAFLANISHELRTPLNSINGFTQLLLKMPLNHKQRDWIESIQKSSHNLLAIINDVLDFSKIEAGKFSLQIHPFNLENAIFEVLESLAPQAESKGLEQIAFIYQDVPSRVKGDALRLKQILTNLVSNAIRFTTQGEIIVRVMLDETRNEQHLLRISVSDTGKGLSTNEKTHLFTAFQQGNPTLSREAGGTGLGLVISKSLVKLMDGDIGFDAEQTQGATFWFTFKVQHHENPEQAPPTLLTHKQILILESHEKNSQLLKSTLFNANAEVKVVKTWLDLYHQAQEASYQVVILDSRDLEKECYQQLYNLRQRFLGMIVLLTGLNDVQSLPESTFDELNIYTLAKPIRPYNLLNLLGQGFSTARFKHVAIDATTPTPVNLHILAVDDHPLNLKLVCTLLEDFGIKVSQAENGQQALTLCQQHAFDLIFMDIQMPEMSGLQATQLIRQQPESKNQKTPIVALTAHALADEQENIQQYGLSDYLTKPLQESQLVDIINRWTGINLGQPQKTITLAKKPILANVDWDECLKLSAGKRDLATDILKMLIDGVPSSKEKLSKSLNEYNLPALLAHTHYLHGATRYCGVPNLRYLTRQLEVVIKESLKYNTENEAHIKQQITQQVTHLLTQLDVLFAINLEEVMAN
jgi:two-component system sensor histidine kinase BarA